MRPAYTFSIASNRDGETVDTFAYRSGKFVVLELEPAGESSSEDALGLVQTVLSGLQQADTVQAFCQGLADGVRGISGFDRVMIYRFLPDGAGCVDAEARGEGVESFLGLHYPASDIPRQARELYFANWIQLIPNVHYSPAPILRADESQNDKPLDLSYSLIRSVSPTHLVYLANMGVVASMSLPIIVSRRLWGLVACHHRAPRFLSHRLRAACGLLAQTASAMLETKVAAEEFEAELKSKRIHEALVTQMSRGADLAKSLTSSRPNLLDYIPAEGAGLWLDSRYTVLGRAPKADEVAALVAWLNETAADGVFFTDQLPLIYPPAAEFAGVAAGLIALSISKTQRDYVLWFRPEVIHTVTWAGNPNKPVEFNDDGQYISPRISFAAWRESVRLHSKPWRSVDVKAAKALRLSLMEVILRRVDQLAREREAERIKQEARSARLDRSLAQWRTVAAELKEQVQRRAKTELSEVLRSTVANQEAERKRIARELHDSLGQTLTLLQLGLDELDNSLPKSTKYVEQLKVLKGLANGIWSEVNRLAWEIRPTALDDLGLETSIRQLIETWSERLRLEFDLHLTLNDRRLPTAVETTLYRVLQEAITNIARHAEATRAAVLLEASEKEVRMIIEDNGQGFSANEAVDKPSKHLGLLGVRERLSLVSGTLEVESAPGCGCTLYIRVPL
jgi:light-regulated signal transduction histidine kinase (bacteriophytochrome)